MKSPACVPEAGKAAPDFELNQSFSKRKSGPDFFKAPIDMTPLTQIKIARGLFKAPRQLTDTDRSALVAIIRLGGVVADARALGALVGSSESNPRNQRLQGGKLIKRLEGMGFLVRQTPCGDSEHFVLTESGKSEAWTSSNYSSERLALFA